MAKSANSRELQCVGRLEIARPKPVGFLCGSIPVPTDESFSSFNSALLPSSPTVSAPRYRMLPTETDLNLPPLLSCLPEKVLPIDYGAVQSRAADGEGVPWDNSALAINLARKGEALAVTGLVEYGDELDVIAPADILKQIFKMPYSKARLSIAVHRIGQTLVLNAGPDVEEGERLVNRHQPKCSDESLFLKFAMHSVRMEACDCPPSHSASAEDRSKASSVLKPDLSGPRKSSFNSSDIHSDDDDAREEQHDQTSDGTKGKENSFYWESENKRKKGRNPIKKASHIGEKTRRSVQESEKYRRGGGGKDEFLRVLFWQFHNFRMLLGSDLLLFSNEKYVAVSLHLWDVSRQVTPLTWLEAWLDNVMASVPELAICYHRNGVVQGYELIKTDDIFLLKGISEDGTPGFHPYIVQQNGLSVLRFLQANCKQDPGAYWLYKSAGEDALQLFDLSVIPQSHSSDRHDDCPSSLPSLIHRGRTDSLLSLGTLLYRVAHRLSFSMASSNRARCARFFKKCLELLDEPDHLVVRALAHEQFARLILNSDDELDLTAEAFPLASEVTIVVAEEESLDIISCISDEEGKSFQNLNDVQDSDSAPGTSEDYNMGRTVPESRGLIAADDLNISTGPAGNFKLDEGFQVCSMTPNSTPMIQTIADPISSKLAAVHHVSQAIKSLRWTRQLQGIEPLLSEHGTGSLHSDPPSTEFSVCACGDTDCIEVCDIREWLPTSNVDHKLWKLVLLLGESYLALGQAYMEEGQLHQALKVVEVACSVYGSVPQHLEDARFISSMASGPKCGNSRTACAHDDHLTLEHNCSKYLFWAKAWTLVGDVYAEFYMMHGDEVSVQSKETFPGLELRMSSEVVKELIRLKKKLSHDKENCSSCYLVNCSCQSDRASSGSSASSSNTSNRLFIHGRRQSKRSHARSRATSHSGNPGDYSGSSDSGYVTDNSDAGVHVESRESLDDHRGEESSVPTSSENAKEAFAIDGLGLATDDPAETAPRESSKARIGGIFKYLRGPVDAHSDDILSASLSCYKEARKALGGLSTNSEELQSVLRKIGWVCNELGRNRLGKKDLAKAELAFADAIDAFREVSDHTNIILINCNLGHGRRASAEELASNMDYFKKNPIFRNAYQKALEMAKTEYSRSLRFYGAAKKELKSIRFESDNVSTGLKNEVCTQFAHTYLRLGMLLAKEDTFGEVYENGPVEDRPVGYHSPSEQRMKKEIRKHKISANDAIREAISIYESLGEIRQQEAAYAYFQLACYQRDCCFKFLDSKVPKIEGSVLQRAKHYASLAERNWQKAIDFYSAKTHPIMYLNILIEWSALSSGLSSVFHMHTMLETALSCLLEARLISEKLDSASLKNDNAELCLKFWSQLQMLLKRMLSNAISSSSNKLGPSSPAKRSWDSDKLRELYKLSLKSTDFSQLHAMHSLWIS